MTHEEFLYRVRDVALSRLNDPMLCERLRRVKVVYGSGHRRLFGRCFYQTWRDGEPRDLIEISAAGEQSPLQLAATVLHEFAHSVAGWRAGHGRAWKRSAVRFGLVRPVAAGWDEGDERLAPDVLDQIRQLGTPTDGEPTFPDPKPAVRPPCPLGIGTKDGTSRGPGSGSRLRLYLCSCVPPVRVRVARDAFHARCEDCGGAFRQAERTERR